MPLVTVPAVRAERLVPGMYAQVWRDSEIWGEITEIRIVLYVVRFSIWTPLVGAIVHRHEARWALIPIAREELD